MIPFLSLCYLLAFLDRSSISNAVLYGLQADIKVTDTQYLIALSIFFISYGIIEIPFNVIMKKIRPSIMLSSIVFIFGVIFTLTGFVKNYAGLLVVRFLLGLAEGGLFPGVNFLMSCWYKRSEFGLRAALFFSAATLSGAFGGLIAAGIGSSSSFVDLGGYPSWSWIFIIEGLATVVTGFAGFWIIPDFPATAKFLTEEEREWVISRLEQDGLASGSAVEGFSIRKVLTPFKDPKIWLGIIMYTGIDASLYGFALFLPTVIKSIGSYSSTQANLLAVPIYVYGTGLAIFVGYYSDKWKSRIIFHFTLISIGILGYIILIASKNGHLSYFALFLAASGIFPRLPSTIALLSSNIESSYKRGVGIAAWLSFGNLNGAVTSNIYRANTAPRYYLGHGIILGYLMAALISNLIYYFYIKKENAAKLAGERDEVIGVEGMAPGEIFNGKEHYETIEQCQSMKGDHYSKFVYML